MKLGDQVIVTTNTGRRIQAVVAMLRGFCGRHSMMLECDAMIGGWAGNVPAIQDVAGNWSTLDGVSLQIEVGELEED